MFLNISNVILRAEGSKNQIQVVILCAQKNCYDKLTTKKMA